MVGWDTSFSSINLPNMGRGLGGELFDQNARKLLLSAVGGNKQVIPICICITRFKIFNSTFRNPFKIIGTDIFSSNFMGESRDRMNIKLKIEVWETIISRVWDKWNKQIKTEKRHSGR